MSLFHLLSIEIIEYMVQFISDFDDLEAWIKANQSSSNFNTIAGLYDAIRIAAVLESKDIEWPIVEITPLNLNVLKEYKKFIPIKKMEWRYGIQTTKKNILWSCSHVFENPIPECIQNAIQNFILHLEMNHVRNLESILMVMQSQISYLKVSTHSSFSCQYMVNSIAKQLSKSNLTELNVECQGDTDVDSLVSVLAHSKVTRLTLSRFKMSLQTFSLQNLTFLDIEETKHVHLERTWILNNISNSNLKELRVGYNCDLKALFEVLPFTQIETLYLTKPHFYLDSSNRSLAQYFDPEFNTFMNQGTLKRILPLRKLVFREMYANQSFLHLIDTILKNSRLTYLGFIQVREPPPIGLITQVAHSGKYLKTLDLTMTRYFEFHSLHLLSLEHLNLNLTNCLELDEVLECFRLGKIKGLSLSNNSYNTDKCEWILKNVTDSCTFLDLRNNKMYKKHPSVLAMDLKLQNKVFL